MWTTASAAAARATAPVLMPLGVTGVPRRRPRLFALELKDERGRAAALQLAVADALGRAGLYAPEGRPFWPHVTIARVRRGKRASAPDAPPPSAEPFAATSMTLYRSELSRRGARYSALRRLELRA